MRAQFVGRYGWYISRWSFRSLLVAERCWRIQEGDPSLSLRIRRMRCTKCGTKSTTSRKFCAACGSPLSRSCPKCGAENAPSSAFCEDCGTALAGRAASAAASSPQASTAPNIRVTPEQSAGDPLDGERKTVTALFADIKGSTELMEGLDPEEARAIIDPALNLMIEAVHRYEGYGAPRRRERRPDGHLRQPCCARDEGRPLEAGGQAPAS